MKQHQITENSDMAALRSAARRAGRIEELNALFAERDAQGRTIRRVITIVEDAGGCYVLETKRLKRESPPQARPDRITMLVSLTDTAERHDSIVMPADVAFWNVDKDMYLLGNVNTLITTGSDLNVEGLGAILTEAYFHPGVDEPGEDPNQSERAAFATDARRRADEILNPAKYEEALKRT